MLDNRTYTYTASEGHYNKNLTASENTFTNSFVKYKTISQVQETDWNRQFGGARKTYSCVYLSISVFLHELR